MDTQPVGYKAICEKLNISTLPHYRESYIAKQGRSKTILENDHEIHIYPKTYALSNENNLLEHLEFALKYDGINLEIISAFFKKFDKNKIEDYIQSQPTGIYARKIWYLYELLMDEKLNLKNCKKIKYVDLLDSKIYFTNYPIKSPRHAVNDNLLGNKVFCPFVRRTEKIDHYIKLHLENKVEALLKKYDPHIIARASNYLYTKETMSSYQIEKERPDKSRLVRFINTLHQASTMESLSKEKLIELQNIIVDPRFKDFDYRWTQNYIGENINPYYQKIHFISPKPEDVNELMQGLFQSLDRMFSSQVHPVIIATVLSFGFVFIHPFEDGNGRIHRFLIHYVLAKCNFTPKNIIFPVSSIMLKNMANYDAILESFSKPLLNILTDYHLSNEGVMTVKQETKSYYQFIDYTKMVEYLFACINDAIYKDLEYEIKFLMKYDLTKKSIQEIVDMPDKEIDLLIRFVIQNHGKLATQKRKKYFSLLTDDEIKQMETLISQEMLLKDS